MLPPVQLLNKEQSLARSSTVRLHFPVGSPPSRFT
jgi:hypothetical protein